MQCNVGKKDKMIRYGLAIIGLPLGYFVSPWFYIVTVAMAVTAKLSFCGLYKVLGVNTCDHDHKAETAPMPPAETAPDMMQGMDAPAAEVPAEMPEEKVEMSAPAEASEADDTKKDM